jgi:hypothetical protein
MIGIKPNFRITTRIPGTHPKYRVYTRTPGIQPENQEYNQNTRNTTRILEIQPKTSTDRTLRMQPELGVQPDYKKYNQKPRNTT